MMICAGEKTSRDTSEEPQELQDGCYHHSNSIIVFMKKPSAEKYFTKHFLPVFL